MILTQLNIATEIVQILFTAIVGALALGLALAFGLGGRNVAERLREEAYQRGREQKEQAKQDLETGRERARRVSQQAVHRLRGSIQPLQAAFCESPVLETGNFSDFAAGRAWARSPDE